MINLLHIYVDSALALAFFAPSIFSYKNCWLFPLDIITLAFFALGRAIDFSLNRRFY